MAKLEVLAYRRTAEVQIAVFHAEVIAAVGVVLDCEWRYLAAVEYVKSVGDYLDVSGGEIGVFRASLAHGTCDLNHEFTAEFVGFVGEFGIYVLTEHHLGYSITVADIDERHAAHLADSLNPSGEFNLLAGIGKSQLAACIVSIHRKL